jgi:hypothetical protein
MPKHPVRQKTTRSGNNESSKPSSPCAQLKEDGVTPLPSHPSSYPDSTECSSAVELAGGSGVPQALDKEPSSIAVEETPAFTEIKIARKRGRKPKIPEMIKETDSSTETPPKKGRRGRPPADGTPAKNKTNGAKKNQEPEKPESNASRPPTDTNPSQSNADAGSDKSSEDYLRELDEVVEELRARSYQIGKTSQTCSCFFLINSNNCFV